MLTDLLKTALTGGLVVGQILASQRPFSLTSLTPNQKLPGVVFASPHQPTRILLHISLVEPLQRRETRGTVNLRCRLRGHITAPPQVPLLVLWYRLIKGCWNEKRHYDETNS